MKRTATTPHRSATTPTINVIYFKITKIPMKRIILSLSLILCVMTIRAAVKVDRIDPANWFVGMKTPRYSSWFTVRTYARPTLRQIMTA